MIVAGRQAARPRVRIPTRGINYRHLANLTDGRGLFEHALFSQPRRDHGYCVDDVARALVVVVREPRPSAVLQQLAETYLRFIEQAIGADGQLHNRMDATGAFTDEPAMGDWWGRAVGALGFAVAHAQEPAMRVRATRAFLATSGLRSTDVRTMAFAALGAAEVLTIRPGSDACLLYTSDAADE